MDKFFLRITLLLLTVIIQLVAFGIEVQKSIGNGLSVLAIGGVAFLLIIAFV